MKKFILLFSITFLTLNIFGQNIYQITPLKASLHSVTLVAADNTTDGTGTIIPLDTGGINGSIINKITFMNSQKTPALSSAMAGRIFLMDSTLAWKFYNEILIDTATRSFRRLGAKSIMITGGLVIRKGDKIGVSISKYAGVQDRTDVTIEGGDY
jgi:hypothetical protein